MQDKKIIKHFERHKHKTVQHSQPGRHLLYMVLETVYL